MKTEAPILQCFNLALNFFGFKPEHQVQLHDQIFDLLWAGEGRWSFHDIYTMPLRIRKLWIARINKMRAAQAEADESQNSSSNEKIPRGPSKK